MTAAEPIIVNVVTTPNFRVDHCMDPDETIDPWYEVTLSDDHTAAEWGAAVKFLPAHVRIDNWDHNGDERTYFYADRLLLDENE